MSDITKYNLPIRDTKYVGRFTRSWGKGLSGLAIVLHGLLPHEKIGDPLATLKGTDIGGDDELFFKASTDIYKESTDRIKSLEEKAFKLLNYISIVSALLIYFLGKNASGSFKYSTIGALFFLVMAILVSLRCIGVKQQKAFYIDSVFKFDSANPPTANTKKEIAASLFNDAVYNNAVADNTADILKAARILLSIGIIFTMVASAFYLNDSTKREPEKTYKTSVSLDDTTFLKKSENHMSFLDSNSKNLLLQMKAITNKLDSLKKK